VRLAGSLRRRRIVVKQRAIIRDAFIFKAEPAAWDAVLRTNSPAPIGCSLLLVGDARAGEGRPRPGSIVNIVSTAGFYGTSAVAYAAAKAGLMGLTRVVAHDLARSRIRCNAMRRLPRPGHESIKPANDAQAATRRKHSRFPRLRCAAGELLASDAAAHVSGQLFGARGRTVRVLAAAPAQRLLHSRRIRARAFGAPPRRSNRASPT